MTGLHNGEEEAGTILSLLGLINDSWQAISAAAGWNSNKVECNYIYSYVGALDIRKLEHPRRGGNGTRRRVQTEELPNCDSCHMESISRSGLVREGKKDQSL